MSKFRRVFTGDAVALRNAMVEHFRSLEQEIARSRSGTDYAAGLDAGRQQGYRDAWQFIRTIEIAELVD